MSFPRVARIVPKLKFAWPQSTESIRVLTARREAGITSNSPVLGNTAVNSAVSREKSLWRQNGDNGELSMWSCELRDYRLLQSGGALPLFDLKEVSRGGICDLGARQSGPVSLDNRSRIYRPL